MRIGATAVEQVCLAPCASAVGMRVLQMRCHCARTSPHAQCACPSAHAAHFLDTERCVGLCCLAAQRRTQHMSCHTFCRFCLSAAMSANCLSAVCLSLPSTPKQGIFRMATGVLEWSSGRDSVCAWGKVMVGQRNFLSPLRGARSDTRVLKCCYCCGHCCCGWCWYRYSSCYCYCCGFVVRLVVLIVIVRGVTVIVVVVADVVAVAVAVVVCVAVVALGVGVGDMSVVAVAVLLAAAYVAAVAVVGGVIVVVVSVVIRVLFVCGLLRVLSLVAP